MSNRSTTFAEKKGNESNNPTLKFVICVVLDLIPGPINVTFFPTFKEAVLFYNLFTFSMGIIHFRAETMISVSGHSLSQCGTRLNLPKYEFDARICYKGRPSL